MTILALLYMSLLKSKYTNTFALSIVNFIFVVNNCIYIDYFSTDKYNSHIAITDIVRGGEKMSRSKKGMPRLTGAESKVMNILWNHDGPITSGQIREEGKDMGIDTYVFKLLNSLIDKGMVKEVGQTVSFKTPTRQFAPAYSKHEYSTYFLEQFCDNSVSQFLTGLVQSTENNHAVIDEIKSWLTEFEKEDE